MDQCHVPGCGKTVIVYLGGRGLCAQHYIENLNELNDLGLTPRGLSEDHPGPGENIPERRIRRPVRGPAGERAREKSED